MKQCMAIVFLTASVQLLFAGAEDWNPSENSVSFTKQDPRPNIIIIVADDMGWGDKRGI